MSELSSLMQHSIHKPILSERRTLAWIKGLLRKASESYKYITCCSAVPSTLKAFLKQSIQWAPKELDIQNIQWTNIYNTVSHSNQSWN